MKRKELGLVSRGIRRGAASREGFKRAKKVLRGVIKCKKGTLRRFPRPSRGRRCPGRHQIYLLFNMSAAMQHCANVPVLVVAPMSLLISRLLFSISFGGLTGPRTAVGQRFCYPFHRCTHACVL